MRYTVIAEPSVDDELLELWLRAANQQALTAAANRIEGALKDDPETKGIFCEGLYIIRDYPLAAVYEVIPNDRVVRVLGFALLTRGLSNGQKPE